MLRKERKLQLRETAIIEAAAQLIDRVGYTHLTMDMLADEAGIAKATLYQHFKSKEDIMIASTRRALENLAAFMDAGAGSAVEQLRAIMRYMMQSGYSADGFPTMVLHDEILHLFSQHAEIRAQFQTLNAQLFGLVESAKVQGDIASDLPNEVIVTLMMNAVEAPKAHLVYPTQSPTALVDYTLRILFDGVKPQ
jgi:AcrR family transcriptional regulator